MTQKTPKTPKKMTNNSSESNKNSDSAFNKNMKTDTPRTNVCPHCGEQGASIRNTYKGEEWFYDCGTHIDAGDSRRTLACLRISEIRDLRGRVKVAENYKNLNDSAFKAVMNELATSKAEIERLTELLSLEEKQHEETRQLCAKILNSTRTTPSMEWHRKNRKVLLK